MSTTATGSRPSPAAAATDARPRVLVADDYTPLAEAFARLLSPECDVVAVVGDGRAAVAEAERLKPDVVVLDIGMPVLNGLDAGRQLKRRLPQTKLVFVTMSEDPELAAEAFGLGASAFLLKGSAASELISAIRAVTAGRSFVTPRVRHAR